MTQPNPTPTLPDAGSAIESALRRCCVAVIDMTGDDAIDTKAIGEAMQVAPLDAPEFVNDKACEAHCRIANLEAQLTAANEARERAERERYAATERALDLECDLQHLTQENEQNMATWGAMSRAICRYVEDHPIAAELLSAVQPCIGNGLMAESAELRRKNKNLTQRAEKAEADIAAYKGRIADQDVSIGNLQAAWKEMREQRNIALQRAKAAEAKMAAVVEVIPEVAQGLRSIGAHRSEYRDTCNRLAAELEAALGGEN